MSSKIDERIVEMKFDSESFQTGVAETSEALKGLKDALKLDNIDSNVEKVASKFNILGVAGFASISKLVDMAIDAGNKIGAAMWEPLVEGGKKRALNLEQARFQFKNLGIDVVAVMADVDYAVDGTAYSLDSAAKAAASLSASQVQVGDDMKTALRGISGVAALTGQEYDRVADIFTKVAGQGRVMGGELQQLNALGMNAAATLKDYMNETGITVGATEADIRKMASESQISFEIFAKAMDGAFGENAKQANDTYTGSLANLRGAFSRIGALHFEGFVDLKTGVQQFSGELQRQTDLFNALRPRVNEVKNALIPLAEVWSEIQGKKNDNLIAFINGIDLSDFTNAMVNFSQGIRLLHTAWNAIVDPIKAAWKEVFPPQATTWMTKIAIMFENFARKLIITREAGENLKGIFVVIFSALKTGGSIVGGVLSVIGNLVGLFFRLLGAVGGLITPIITFFASFFKGAKDSSVETQGFFDVVNKFISGGIEPLIELLNKAGDAFNNFLNDGKFMNRMRQAGQWFKDVGGLIAMVWNTLMKGDFTSNAFFQEDDGFVDVLLRIREAFVAVIDAFKSFFKFLSEGADNAGSVWDGIVSVVKYLLGMIKPFTDEIKKIFDGLRSGVDMDMILAGINFGALTALGVGIFKIVQKFMSAAGEIGALKDIFKNGIKETFDGISGVLEGYQSKLKADKLITIAIAIGILAGALWVLSTIDPERLIPAVAAMATSFGILLGALKIMDKIDAAPSLKMSVTLGLIAVAVNILATALAKMGSMNPEQLMNGLIAMATSVLVLVLALQAMEHIDDKSVVTSAFAMNVMAAAIITMAGAVALFGIMPLDMLIQGGIAVAATLALLTGAAVLISKFAKDMILSSVGLIAMAIALNMLVAPIALLGLLPYDVLQQGMIALGIILGALVIAAIALNFLAPSMILSAVGILAMAVALGMLVTPIMLLGVIPFEVLNQGILALAGVLAVLVIAALAMTGAAVGAAGMIAMAAAILILSLALGVLAGLGLEAITQAVLGLVIAIGTMAAIAIILTLLAPVMLVGAGIMGILAIAALGLAAASVIISLGMMMMGPAMLIAIGGLMAFAAAAEPLMGAVGPMLAIGAALLVFGAGALVGGAGALVLGIGLLVLAAGLALVAAVGLLGVFALEKVVVAMSNLLVHIPGMLALGATFVVIGAGLLVLGAGLALVSVSALLMYVVFLSLIPMGALVALSMALIVKGIERLIPMTEKIAAVSVALGKFAAAVLKLATAGSSAASGLIAVSLAFAALTIATSTVGMAMVALATLVAVSMASLIVNIAKVPPAFVMFVAAILLSMNMLNAGLLVAAATVTKTSEMLGRAVGTILVASMYAQYGVVYSVAIGIGEQMTAGMNRGLQNGSYSVERMAARVARAALEAAKTELDINSPSRKTELIGKQFDEGFARGSLKNISVVESAGKEVGSKALEAMRDSLADLKDSILDDMDYNPTIRPIYDLSAVKKDADIINGLLSTPSFSVGNSYAMASMLSQQQRTIDESSNTRHDDEPTGGDTYVQNNYSPKAISPAEQYRNTKNLISLKKGPKPKNA